MNPLNAQSVNMGWCYDRDGEYNQEWYLALNGLNFNSEDLYPSEGFPSHHISSPTQAVSDYQFNSYQPPMNYSFLTPNSAHNQLSTAGSDVSSSPWDYTSAGTPDADNSVANTGSPNGPPFSSTLTQSARGANSSKSHKCSKCPQSFSLKKDLNRHSSSKHRRPGDPLFRCRCGYEDSRRDNYKRHLDKCKKELDQYRYVCKCGGHECVAKEEHEEHIRGCMRKSNRGSRRGVDEGGCPSSAT
ncbi:hypothetical protein F4861DRAFT_545791 [Xylaria intraflava]|nr:hypothetical protein F4861DRAFT_545791 [Xylaria intraflava]